MGRTYISVAETAKLVRLVLKEALPGVKFGVRCKSYSGGASISIEWTDGPNPAQVKAVADLFESSYVDGTIDYKGAIYHLMDGKPVRFGSDFIHYTRHSSDAAVRRAIDRVFRKYAGNFSRDGVAKPTLEDFRNGRLWSVHLSGLHHHGNDSVQAEVYQVLNKGSDRFHVLASKTRSRVFVTHDDGYSRTNGCGLSVLSAEDLA